MTTSWSGARKPLILGLIAAGIVALAAALLFAARTSPTPAGAADHLDAPGLTPPGGDVRLDITDVYAFRSVPGKTVLVMNVNGFTKAGKQATFAAAVPGVAATKRVTYNLRVDSNGDAKEDVVLAVKFGLPKSGVQTLALTRNGKTLVTGMTSRFGKVVINNSAGVRVYAGMRDDPFFFDLDGFINILTPAKSFLGCKTARSDKFAGSNVSSIVIELPSSRLTKGKSMIGVWATTNRGAAQVDRMGRPAIATVFIPANPFEATEASLKNTYNKGKPANDQAAFRAEVVDSLTTLYSLNDKTDNTADDKSKIAGLADVLLPDILTFDMAKSDGFLNGRRLADDVIDAELNLITEGAATTDCVSKNDTAFMAKFPYLARPH